MRNLILTIILSFFMMNGNALVVSSNVFDKIVFNVSVQWEDPTSNTQQSPKSPIQEPCIFLDDHTLYFGTPCDGCTLNVVDSNDVVVYTTVIPVGATSLVLPSTLSGEYELQIIQGYYCFYGPITL